MIRITKKEEIYSVKSVFVRIGAVVLALIISGVMIAIMGYRPLQTFEAMIRGSLGSAYGIRNSINIAVPYLITALGISIAFRMRFWNIGAEGQIVMGAVFATWIARILSPDLNGFLLIVLMMLASLVGGGLWALIPAVFKAYTNTNETLFTLMMNYIAIKVTLYLRSVVWKDPEAMGFPKIAQIPQQARLPKVFGIHIGWIIVLVLVMLVYIFIKYTKKGYEIKVVGESDKTAHYAGMNVKKVLVTGVLISGALAGLAGAIKLMGMSFSVSESIGGGDGFTAIIIAWLSGLQAPVMLLVSFLFAAMKQGSIAIEARMNIPSSVADIIQGAILLCTLGSEFFLRYKVVWDIKSKHQIDGDTFKGGVKKN
jgi:general nucleoside transport system permease protein